MADDTGGESESDPSESAERDCSGGAVVAVGERWSDEADGGGVGCSAVSCWSAGLAAWKK